MSSTDNALGIGILATFFGAGYLIYKKFPNLFKGAVPEVDVPLNSDDLTNSDDWTKTRTDTTTTPEGNTIINYIIEGSGKWKDYSFESKDINPTPQTPIKASGDKIIGVTSQGYNIYETTTGFNPIKEDSTQYEGYIGNSTPAKVKHSSSRIKTVPETIKVSQPTRDTSGFSKWDRIIQKNKGLSDTEAKKYLGID